MSAVQIPEHPDGSHPNGMELRDKILGGKPDGERLTPEEKRKLARFVMAQHREVLAKLAK